MIMKQIKNVAWTLAPSVMQSLHTRHMRKYFHNTHFVSQQQKRNILFGNDMPHVLRGPFKGMKYIDETVWGPIEPKWLGCYEAELHGIIENITRDQYQTIVDVGSAEGYYSVGFAYLFKDSKVISYDVDPWARAQQKRLADLNSIRNLEIRKYCTTESLISDVGGAIRALALIDVEGYEYNLLNEKAPARLKNCDLLIEMHDNVRSKIDIRSGTIIIKDRFRNTHEIKTVYIAPRNADAMTRSLKNPVVDTKHIADMMDEFRKPDQVWLWLKAI